MKSLQTILQESLITEKKWDSPDTNKIKDFLSELFDVTKESFGDYALSEIHLVATKEGKNKQCINWGDNGVRTWMERINKWRDSYTLQVELDENAHAKIIQNLEKYAKGAYVKDDYDNVIIDINTIAENYDNLIKAVDKSSETDINFFKHIRVVVDTFCNAFDDTFSLQNITLCGKKFNGSHGDVITWFSKGNNKVMNEIKQYKDKYKLYIEINQQINSRFFNYVKTHLKGIYKESKEGNLDIDLGVAVQNFQKIFDEIND